MRGTDPISARNAGFDLEASALADGLRTLGPRRLPTASERLRPEAVQNGCEALTQSVHDQVIVVIIILINNTSSLLIVIVIMLAFREGGRGSCDARH
jgi:hypothetical protein